MDSDSDSWIDPPLVLRFNSPTDTTPRDGSHGSAPEAQPHVAPVAALVALATAFVVVSAPSNSVGAVKSSS